jgi:hypothetical protein
LKFCHVGFSLVRSGVKSLSLLSYRLCNKKGNSFLTTTFVELTFVYPSAIVTISVISHSPCGKGERCRWTLWSAIGQAWFLPVTAKQKYTGDPGVNGVITGRFFSWLLSRNKKGHGVRTRDLFI